MRASTCITRRSSIEPYINLQVCMHSRVTERIKSNSVRCSHTRRSGGWTWWWSRGWSWLISASGLQYSNLISQLAGDPPRFLPFRHVRAEASLTSRLEIDLTDATGTSTLTLVIKGTKSPLPPISAASLQVCILPNAGVSNVHIFGRLELAVLDWACKYLSYA